MDKINNPNLINEFELQMPRVGQLYEEIRNDQNTISETDMEDITNCECDDTLDRMNEEYAEDGMDGYDQSRAREPNPILEEYHLENESPNCGNDDTVGMMRTLSLKDLANDYVQYSESEASTSEMTKPVCDYMKDMSKDFIMVDKATGYEQDSKPSTNPELTKDTLTNELGCHFYDDSATNSERHRNCLKCAKFLASTMQPYTSDEERLLSEDVEDIYESDSSTSDSDDYDSDYVWDRMNG